MENMEKIIQIQSDVESLYCLTADGKVYERKMKELKEVKTDNGYKKIFEFYWSEVMETEVFEKEICVNF